MFKDSIKTKIITLLLIVALIPFAFISITSLITAEDAIDTLVEEKLTSVRDIKKTSLQSYFSNIESQIRLVAENSSTIEAMNQFSQAFAQQPAYNFDNDIKDYWQSQFGTKYQQENGRAFDTAATFAKLGDKAIHFQNAYIGQNPSALGEKNNFLKSPANNTYDKVHEYFHPWFDAYLNEFGYYDIFLVNLKGEIVYSVFKELDFATSLEKGPWSNTGIAEAYRAGLKLKAKDVFFTDLALYAPSYDAPAGFVSAPIFKDGKKAGVLIFQMPLDRISEVMSLRTGLGETGESYLVGQDNLMRSDSYLDPEGHSVVNSFRNPEQGSVTSEAAMDALAGRSGFDVVTDYNGNPVASAFTPVTVGANQWALLVEIDVAEAYASNRLLEAIILISALAGIVFIIIVGYIYASRLVKPVINFANTIADIGRTSDFSTRITVKGNDEIAQAGTALNSLLKSTDTTLKEVNNVMKNMAEGDFSSRIETTLSGDLNKLKQGVNKSLNTVDKVLLEVDSAVNGLAKGDFKNEVNVIGQGQFKHILSSIQGSMGIVNNALNNISDVMELMSNGDFSGRVTAEAHGDLETLAKHINVSMDGIGVAIDGISGVVAAQAAGDLTKELPKGRFLGQLHDLKNAINYSSMKMREAVATSKNASMVVSQAAHEVDQGAASLSGRVQEQAAALEQTSATMDEMNSQVKSNSENALSAKEMATQMAQTSQKGVEVMHQTISAMSSIQESSEKINDIVSLIDGIAFQTNLLALNAAVEAARAGEHGRGFAVVAGEVRALAQKAGDAAKDIKVLVEETSTRVDSGSGLAQNSGDMLEKMSEISHEVSQMINQIAIASSEQSEGVHQVHDAITQIDDVTQQNAALVEETTAAAESLNHQATILKDEMAFFTIDAGQVQAIANDSSKPVLEKQSSKPALKPKSASIEHKPMPNQQNNGSPSNVKAVPESSAKSSNKADEAEWNEF